MPSGLAALTFMPSKQVTALRVSSDLSHLEHVDSLLQDAGEGVEGDVLARTDLGLAPTRSAAPLSFRGYNDGESGLTGTVSMYLDS